MKQWRYKENTWGRVHDLGTYVQKTLSSPAYPIHHPCSYTVRFFAVLALFALAYATAEDAILTDEQITALTQEEAVAITDEEWINIFTSRCTPTSTYYWASQYFSDVRDCHHFYECVGFKPVRMECAANLHFNRKLNVCDYPANAGCKWYNPTPAVPVPIDVVPYDN
uniref:Chitin-binding type-2 domain-containing protein n=1 Tax=Timema douglasi TaxID=61478 RepID=A0A7R8Z9C6_TIMDO|nr:unnamed protein product [Timema douglasi]